jgi:stearoyl-CoA desaturase (delta-9 desaturase)
MGALQLGVMFLSVVGPFAGLIGAIVMLWHRTSGYGVGGAEVLVMLCMYALTGFGVTIGFHRLFTHQAFQAPRAVHIALAICGSAAGQGMLIRWCATHRRHHQLSDRAGDPHSPHKYGDRLAERLKGLWHAHVGWCFEADETDLGRSVADLRSDRTLLVIDQLYFLWVTLGLVIPACALGWFTHSWRGFISGLIWGGLLRIFLTQHVTWSVNSVCHVWGNRPFRTADHSTNNWPVAILSLGEGWHNNHHAFPTSARHGLRWWQFDATYLVIKAMSFLGLAWDLHSPQKAALAAKRIRP